jgi:hypothetical protein
MFRAWHPIQDYRPWLLSTLVVATVLLFLAVLRWMSVRSKATAVTIQQLEQLQNGLNCQAESGSRRGEGLINQRGTT